MRTRFQISDRPLVVETLVEDVADPAAGAVATFSGTARNSFRGKEVRHLEYEAYPEMAEPVMKEIGMEIANRWPSVIALAIAHRVGRLEIGQTSVIVAVSAPHRREALEACAYGIDRLKATLPVWKKEVFADGEVWRENVAGEGNSTRGGEPP